MADVCKVCGGRGSVRLRMAGDPVDANGLVYALYQWCPIGCVKETASAGYADTVGEPYLLHPEPQADTPVEVRSDGGGIYFPAAIIAWAKSQNDGELRVMAGDPLSGVPCGVLYFRD